MYIRHGQVRGEEIISSLGHACEPTRRDQHTENQNHPVVLRSAGMHPRGSTSRPPAILFNPLFSLCNVDDSTFSFFFQSSLQVSRVFKKLLIIVRIGMRGRYGDTTRGSKRSIEFQRDIVGSL